MQVPQTESPSEFTTSAVLTAYKALPESLRPFYAHIHCGSAAIVAALRTSEHLPARDRIEAVGYGAGKRPYEGCSGTLRCLLVHVDA